MPVTPRLALGSLLFAAACADVGCACADPAAAATPKRANVLLVVIDTLRADRLSCYGYARPTTPEIDRLAARGLRFERAYGTAPWTLPSTGSLLSGLQPDVHRATGFLASISPQARLLAQELSERGFETAAFIGNYFVQPLFGFDRGFESYNGDCMVDRAGINSGRLSDKALEWLARPRERPFLLYLHYFDPHYNYWEHQGFAFGGEDTDRVFSGEDIYELREHAPHLDDADRARLDSLYDSEVAFTDHHVGRVLRRLEELGLSENTCVLLTSDHGEALGEHGWIGHTIQLYEESVRVPLILAGPGIAPGVRGGEPVQLDDVFEPLLALATDANEGAAPLDFLSAGSRLKRGLLDDEALLSVQITGLDEPGEARPRRITNRGAWRLLVDRDESGEEVYKLFKTDEPRGRRRRRPEDHPAELRMLLQARQEEFEERCRELARSHAVITRRRALVKGAFKLIADEISGEVELYDLENDPGERRNLAGERGEQAAAMKRRIEQLVAAFESAALPAGAEVSAEEAEASRRRLEQIGYGSGR
jgi:arylsulfatase A-like enzyme